MDKLIAFYLRSVSNKHIDMLYRHVMRLEIGRASCRERV